jgi:hypothetical protein
LDVTGGTGTDFALTYHFVYFEVVGGGLNLTAANGGAPLIVNGSVHYYGGGYKKNLSSSGASVVASSSGTVTVTLRHKVGIDYLGSGQELDLKPGPIGSKSISKGDAPQTVEICQAGIQAFYGSNFFKVNTNAGSNDFVDIKGATVIDGQLTGTNASFDTANIASLTISELSISSTQLTLPGDLRVTGDVYVLATSDKKLKTNIIPIKNPLLKLSKINGYQFDWKDGYEKIHGHRGQDVGVLAQEVEEILPEVVVERPNGYKAVDYPKIIPLLIEGMKEQQKQIEDLQEQIKKLK